MPKGHPEGSGQGAGRSATLCASGPWLGLCSQGATRAPGPLPSPRGAWASWAHSSSLCTPGPALQVQKPPPPGLEPRTGSGVEVAPRPRPPGEVTSSQERSPPPVPTSSVLPCPSGAHDGYTPGAGGQGAGREDDKGWGRLPPPPAPGSGPASWALGPSLPQVSWKQLSGSL